MIEVQARQGWNGCPKVVALLYSGDKLERKIWVFETGNRGLMYLRRYWQETRTSTRKRKWRTIRSWGFDERSFTAMKELPTVPGDITLVVREAFMNLYKNAPVIVADLK